MTLPPIKIARLLERIATLSQFTVPERPWTRRAFSPEFEAARRWLRGEFERAGLTIHQDAACNLIGRREGTDPSLPPILIGSHCDTVPSGGRLDGILGVLAGLEALETLIESGIQLKHTVELIDFLAEEPTDYGISCVGSRALAGVLSEAMLNSKNPAGETLKTAILRYGGNPADFTEALRPRGSIAAYLELHIEQGPVLENKGIPIGIVTDIVGIRRLQITIEGRADHAGTTPMDVRRDALLGASLLIEACYHEARALNTEACYVVATIGRILVSPNASNAVPGRVELTLEVRSNQSEILAQFAEGLLAKKRPDIERLGLSLDSQALSASLPSRCHPDIMNTLQTSADTLQLNTLHMTSGAGHDAAYVSLIGPVGMIFIPCYGGRSHCPEEDSDSASIEKGTALLCHALCALDADPPL